MDEIWNEWSGRPWIQERYTIVCGSAASVQNMRLIQRSSKSILMPKFSWAWLSSKPFWYGQQKNKRLIAAKEFLIQKWKKKIIFWCQAVTEQRWLMCYKKKNDTLRLKCGYRHGCHMQWQFGSRGSYHEKDIVVHLTGEIYSPNRWYD